MSNRAAKALLLNSANAKPSTPKDSEIALIIVGNFSQISNDAK